jgi:phenylalanine-4-hydroxylase
MQKLPRHLQKYIVSQNYEKYTPVDQACWRFIMRQLKSFLSQHAHECYVEGLEKTGVEIESIPRIEEISAKLEKFGWRALPVSGFIPPAAFMELQSLSILPIASDMRTVDHLMYTPAPDIVHEAAGHAPILIHPEFAAYLKQYAQVAKKALISKEDMDLYDAIRKLSDLKESPDSTPEQITNAQKHLDFVSKNISHISEASELSRMNWWTAEYGLIGDLTNPKIFGAGLLSSVGESKWCLSDKVKKIPLTVDCIKTTYDITEPQPQLFVAKNFQNLSVVLEEMAQKMAFRIGGLEGIEKAICAQTVNTAELNSGIQISGQFVEVLQQNSKPIYLRSSGPTQLAYKDSELSGHDKKYHAQGFGTAVGFFKHKPNVCPSELSDQDLNSLNIQVGKKARLEFLSNVIVEGVLQNITRQDGKMILMTFADARVSYGDRILFEPSWGIFDMAVGSKITSVFAGPADRVAYGETDDFVAARVPQHQYTETEKLLHRQYQEMRALRNSKQSPAEMKLALQKLLQTHDEKFPQDWLFRIEAIELAQVSLQDSVIGQALLLKLEEIQQKFPDKKEVIQDGLRLLN